jgi:beta-phosphoglucomutase-like phosphatase (HAD superfamily)
MTTNRVLMLDFDGVLLRNPKIQRYVGNACNRWLAHKTQTRYIEAKTVNRAGYQKYGHTSLVLQKEFNEPCQIGTFNRELYQEYVRPEVWSRLLNDADITHATQFANSIIVPWQEQQGSHSVFVFSNAPSSWCKTLMRTFNIRHLIPETCFVCSNTLDALKPYWQAYMKAEEAVKFVCPTVKEIIMVDDQQLNLDPIHVYPTVITSTVRWEGLHYSSETSFETIENALTHSR